MNDEWVQHGRCVRMINLLCKYKCSISQDFNGFCFSKRRLRCIHRPPQNVHHFIPLELWKVILLFSDEGLPGRSSQSRRRRCNVSPTLNWLTHSLVTFFFKQNFIFFRSCVWQSWSSDSLRRKKELGLVMTRFRAEYSEWRHTFYTQSSVFKIFVDS